MTTSSKDGMLEKGVNKFIKRKIKDVKCLEDIILMGNFHIEKPFQSEDCDLYNQLSSFKKILQLTINVYKHFEIYKDLKVKLQPTERDAMPFYSSCPGDAGLLTCLHRPSDMDVSHALYNYVLCFLSLKKKDDSIGSTDDPIYKCSFCDEEFVDGAKICEVCGASVEEVVKDLKIMSLRQKGGGNESIAARKEDAKKESEDNLMKEVGREANVINEERERPAENLLWDEGNWKCGKCGLFNPFTMVNCQACCAGYREGQWQCVSCQGENRGDKEECARCEKRNHRRGIAGLEEGKMADSQQIDTKEEERWTFIQEEDGLLEEAKENKNYNQEKETRVQNKVWSETDWKCGKCGLFNRFVMANCQACGEVYQKGRWLCLSCGVENVGATEDCSGCRKRNEGKGIAIAQGKGRAGNEADDGEDWTDKWKCVKCSLLQPLSAIECGACHRSRAEVGSWKCLECTFISPCTSNQCQICESVNKYVVKICRSCKRDVPKKDKERCDACVEKNPGPKWWCSYEKCGGMNKTVDDYCSRCGLARNFLLNVAWQS